MFCYIVINKAFPVPLVPEEHAGAPEAKGWLGMSPIHGTQLLWLIRIAGHPLTYCCTYAGIFAGDHIIGLSQDDLSNDGSSTIEDEKVKDPVTVSTTSV